MPTDTSERGLESHICTELVGHSCEPAEIEGQTVRSRADYGGVGWMAGHPDNYNRKYCLDLPHLTAFLHATQPKIVEAMSLGKGDTAHRKFLDRLQGEIKKRGVIDVLREGMKHGPHTVELFYRTPSENNEKAKKLFDQNRFTVTRQLRYSHDESRRALDIGLFINGLPVFTFELKNNLTKQTVEDAIEQYKGDRDPREELFKFGRCVAHFAVDENEVWFCTHLKGKESWFLPFNRGWNDGAGNPPNPNGIKTDYLWREILTRKSLADIIDNYAQVVKKKDERTSKKNEKVQIWPRYHQLDVVRRLLEDARAKGAGQRYLIQHSAGSGKSNSIAWLAHQLIGISKDDAPIFDSIIVVTDRRLLDRQINDTIKQYAQVGAIVGHAEKSGDLKKFIRNDKKIIISTVQKFPFIVEEIGAEQRGRRFAIIIDEAHSSQGGRTSAAMSRALSGAGAKDEEESYEDQINRLMESRKLLSNASYFAFTATPKNKTLEIFGKPSPPQADGSVKHRAFHSYTMKQAIQERFILDVLANYTTVRSHYEIAKVIKDDPEFDVARALKKIRRYVEGHDYSVQRKAEIMVEHFYEHVARPRRIDGKARAMVVTSGIKLAVKYFHAIRDALQQRKSRDQAIVAFSGEHNFGGQKVTEASLNGFPSKDIARKIQEAPYRFLICADKFQTGYDEPLLHTMYVDKKLSGIKAVQTLSRLNRAHPKKHDTFVLDFANDTDMIRDAFADYYRTTILADEADPNKLHNLQADLDNAQVYAPGQIREFMKTWIAKGPLVKLHKILDECVAVYRERLDEDEQIAFKSRAKAFVRNYNFLSCILPYTNAEWEERSVFLNFLVRKLPSPEDEDFAKGVLEAIDMESYRVEKEAVQAILLPDADAEIEPVPTDASEGRKEVERDILSRIVEQFNKLFGGIEWLDKDRVVRMITEDIPKQALRDKAYRNARENSDKDNARIELGRVLGKIVLKMINDDAELYKQFTSNEEFQRFVLETVFKLTYDEQKKEPDES